MKRLFTLLLLLAAFSIGTRAGTNYGTGVVYSLTINSFDCQQVAHSGYIYDAQMSYSYDCYGDLEINLKWGTPMTIVSQSYGVTMYCYVNGSTEEEGSNSFSANDKWVSWSDDIMLSGSDTYAGGSVTFQPWGSGFTGYVSEEYDVSCDCTWEAGGGDVMSTDWEDISYA